MILPAYAAKIFAELPGETRREKAAALNKLFELLRAERDGYVPPVEVEPPRGPTLTSVRATLIGKTLSQLKNRQVRVDGLLISVASLVHALEAPGHVLHEKAKAEFEAAKLKVVIEPGFRRPRRRIVNAPAPQQPVRLDPLPDTLKWADPSPADSAVMARILRIAGQGRKDGDQ